MKVDNSYTSIRLEVTSKCNLRCAYCHNAKYEGRSDDLSTQDMLTLIERLKEKYDIKKVLLTGGEPLIKNDICDIISKIASLGIKVDMVTNGTLLNSEKVKELQKAGLKRIRLSVDEISSITKMRGTSNPNEIWKKAVMIANNSDIELCIHTVCTPFNVNQMFDIYQKVLDVEAKRWRVFDIGYQGDFIDNRRMFSIGNYYQDLIASTCKILEHYLKNNLKDVLDIEINNVFRTEFLRMKESDYRDFDVYEKLASRRKLSPCNYVTAHQLSIRSDGTSTLCQYFHNRIFDFSTLDVENAIKFATPCEEYILTMQNLPYCTNCRYCMVCNSGCRSRAYFLTGNMIEADPVACYLHPLVHRNVMSMLPEYVQKIYEGFIVPTGTNPKYTFADLQRFLIKNGYEA